MNAYFKIDNKIIETDRLLLRAFNENDLDDLFAYASISGVGEMAGWKHHTSKEESKEILDMFIKNDNVFAIVLKENNKVIGSIGIEKYSMEDKLTEFNNYIGRELGYVLSKEYWGKGLMPEAIKAIIDYLFNSLNYDFLTCGYFLFNSQSKRAQEKVGFKPYRKITFTTRYETVEEGILSLLINPNKNIKFIFSNPETLI